MSSLREAFAVYELCVAALTGEAPASAVRFDAAAASLEWWERVLDIEGCGPTVATQLRGTSALDALPEPVRSLLAFQASASFQNSLSEMPQLAAIAGVARQAGIAVLVLKGAARLLAGEPGVRRMADLDLLTAAGDAPALHAMLMSQLGYASADFGSARHLPALDREGRLSVEIHTQLRSEPTPLDATIWMAPRRIVLGDEVLLIPSATNLLLHTLEHAVIVHTALRYRLRDLLDVAAIWTPEVDGALVLHHVDRSDHQRQFETLLSAAHTLAPLVPCPRPDAWRVIRRVARARCVARPTTR